MPKRYKILMAVSAEKLAADVEALLNDGWFCQGGVSISCEDGEDVLAQAMVKGRSKE